MKNHLIVLSALCILNGALAQTGGGAIFKLSKNPPVDAVDPLIGSGGHGHVFVGASVPFGAVQLGPENFYKGWDWCSGYNYGDSVMIGFAHTHLSGTGIGDLADILIMPYTGAIKTDKGAETIPGSGYASHYSHTTETARPGYYSVNLDDYGIRAELTASERVGFHQYQFPAGKEAHVIIDLKEGINDQSTDTWLHQVDQYTFEGYRRSKGWAKDQWLFFAVKSSVPIRKFNLYDNGQPLEGGDGKGQAIKGVLSFDQAPSALQLKVGLSPVSAGNALANINAEIPGWDFTATASAAREKWNKELAKVEITTSGEKDRRIFYTALYHTMIDPALSNDANGDYRGADKQVHQHAPFTNYSVFSLWDTYRAEHPLLTILQPRRVSDMVQTMLAIGQQQKLLPIWHLMANETGTMVGVSSLEVIAEAWLKGIKGFDGETAYQALKHTAMSDTLGLQYVREGKPIPADLERRTVARAMEYAIGEGSIALMAQKMGYAEDYEYFRKRAQDYKLYYDKNSGFFRGVNSNGNFTTPFDPFKTTPPWSGAYAEGNAWQYLWLTPQDIKGLMTLMGGEKLFLKRLDSLFSAEPAERDTHALADITGAIGQYAHGNEPSHHITYLYTYGGRQWQTAEKVRYILKEMYHDNPDGVIGNEDCGQMSAWYVFSSLGFYPVFPASGAYLMGSPLFDKATIHLDGGKTFTITAIGNGPEDKYIQNMVLNGRPQDKVYITHDEIMSGGELIVTMGRKPNYHFGEKETQRPPNGIDAGSAPATTQSPGAPSVINYQRSFDGADTTLDRIGRGLCSARDGVLRTRNAYASFGDTTWTDYEIDFSARTPETASQVQVWAGFRARDRQDYYSLGFRGGEQNTFYLARRGYMGKDEFLALRPLGFHPLPGKWYDFRIAITGDRIRVYLDKESQPRIDVTDKNSRLLPSGKVTLGGGWIETEYAHLSVKSLSRDMGGAVEELRTKPTPDKERQRSTERAAWLPVKVTSLPSVRTGISLDGRWLFMPSYEGITQEKAISPDKDDKSWHVMSVPSFWNPTRIWLHGETFGPHAKGASDNYFQQETDRCEAYSFDYKKTDQAWYRQWIELPEAIKGRTSELIFDAVSKVAEVYINGKRAGSHVGMFGEFRVDGTGLFRAGKNLVAVKVSRDYGKSIVDANKVIDVAVSVPVTNKMVHDLPHGFYGGDPAGIWQPVRLLITGPVKITDVFIQPSLTGAKFQVTIKNMSDKPVSLAVATTIVDKKDKSKLYDARAPGQIELPSGEEKEYSFSVQDLKPRLWSPETPDLYDFTFRLSGEAAAPLDSETITSGFRTFESKDGYFSLNGKRYWLRGGNQTPFALEPDSTALADKFFQLMKAGNIEVTRTHTAPYNERWMDAADRNGIGISYEGTWPWLFLSSSMPDTALISLWADEFMDLLKKYRNHPSLLLWTVNNEMKFYDNDPDPQRARLKMRIISEVVKRMRKTDPSRPICFDSNYHRNVKKFGQAFFNDIDDGDIDDVHAYVNWYDYSLFKQFKGEFQTQYRNEGRPLISQEMSTGYPNAETGHATRFYTIVHQTPQSLIGDLAYENSDPANFLKTHAFITGELAEAFRRSDEKASGIIHFALITWFRNVYDPKRIEPYPVYDAMKRALQPVLVSAELWGRHFYSGQVLPARICIVNDQKTGQPLAASTLDWELINADGKLLASGKSAVPAVPYYGRQWLTPEIRLPAELPAPRVNARLVLTLTEKGQVLSSNEYGIVLAKKEWSAGATDKKVVLVDFSQMHQAFDFLNIRYTPAATVGEAVGLKAGVYVFAGLDPGRNCSADDLIKLKALITAGAKVLLLDAPAAAKTLYPDYIRGWIVPTEGDIVNMEIPESPVYDGIEPLELRYFNNNQREIPAVCHAALQLYRDPHVEALAMQMKIHGYVEGDMARRTAYMESIKGFPIVKITDGGTAMISTMSLEKAVTDPIAGKLLSNMIDALYPCAAPTDTLIVRLNKDRFHPGDTVSFSCRVPPFAKDSTVGTLHVILENIHTHRRWRYRYPVINGEAAGDLVIGGGIGDGNYAVNFVVQRRFFRVEGQVKDYHPRLSPLTYVVMIRNKPGYIDKITPEPDGSFRLKPTYFEDTAYFVFSAAKKEQTSRLWIDVRTQLDSAFAPYASATRFVTVAAPGDSVPPPVPSDYHFDWNKLTGPGLLPGVVVSGKTKKLVDRFNEEYSTGLFRSNTYMVFDGLENDAIAKSYSIYDFLRFQIPGFTAKANNDGGYDLRWRNSGVTIFLDEYPLLHPNDVYIDPADVAMIKVYQPPSVLSGRSGVIAVYTKKGDYDVKPRRKNKFKVAGYTEPLAEWE